MDSQAQPADRYVEGTYWRQHPGFHLEDSFFKARAIALALQSLDLGPAPRVCDVGCGAGGVLHHVVRLLAEGGTQVATARGYDVSERALNLGKEVFPELDLRLGSGAEVEPGYDVILVLDVLEHLDDYYAFLRSLAGKSRWYLFHIPMEMNALRVLHPDDLRDRWNSSGHIHHFCETTARLALQAAGFEVVRSAWTDVDAQDRACHRHRRSLKRRIVDLLRRWLFRVSPAFAVALLGDKGLLLVASDTPHDDG